MGSSDLRLDARDCGECKAYVGTLLIARKYPDMNLSSTLNGIHDGTSRL